MSKWNVFISKKSEDFAFAKQVYDMLVANGSKVFLSEISIPEENRADYQETVEQAIDQCEHMVVVASSHENIVSPWVKEEWRIFLSDLRSGRKTGNIVTVLAGGITVNDLPAGLRIRQSLHLDSHGLSELLHYVKSKDGPQDASEDTAAAEARQGLADAALAQHRASRAETAGSDDKGTGSTGTKPKERRRFAAYGIAAAVCIVALLAAFFLKDHGSRLQGHTEKPGEAAQAPPDAKQGGTQQASDENSVTIEAKGILWTDSDTFSGKKKPPRKFTPTTYALCIAKGLLLLSEHIGGKESSVSSIVTVGNWRFSSLIKPLPTAHDNAPTSTTQNSERIIENVHAKLIVTEKTLLDLTDGPEVNTTMSVNGQTVTSLLEGVDAMQSTVNASFPTWNEYNANPDAPIDFFGIKLSDFAIDESGIYSIKLTFSYDKRDLRLSQ